ncbi:MAG: hypothetical protein ACK5MF_18385 [Vibrio sp.]
MFSSVCVISSSSARPVARMPVPNRHVTGRGHHRSPQPSKGH